MKVIGITGPIGAGKSYVAKLFAEHGIPSLDTDKIYHELIEKPSETVDEIVFFFGNGVLDPEGGIDRAQLGRSVFGNTDKLTLLNEITHKHIRAKTVSLINEMKESGEEVILLEVPLMFESGFDKLCDTVVCVVCDEAERVQRIMQRNGLSEAEAKKRIKNQKDIDFYLAKSNKIVYNNIYDDVRAQVSNIIDEIK